MISETNTAPRIPIKEIPTAKITVLNLVTTKEAASMTEISGMVVKTIEMTRTRKTDLDAMVTIKAAADPMMVQIRVQNVSDITEK